VGGEYRMVEGCCGPSIPPFAIRYSIRVALMANWRTFALPKCLRAWRRPPLARSLISVAGPKQIRLRDLRITIALDRSRLKFACRIKTAHCKYNEFTTPEKFCVQRQRDAPRMTANNNEHQCRGQRPGHPAVGRPSWPPYCCSHSGLSRGAPYTGSAQLRIARDQSNKSPAWFPTRAQIGAIHEFQFPE